MLFQTRETPRCLFFHLIDLCLLSQQHSLNVVLTYLLSFSHHSQQNAKLWRRIEIGSLIVVVPILSQKNKQMTLHEFPTVIYLAFLSLSFLFLSNLHSFFLPSLLLPLSLTLLSLLSPLSVFF